MPGRSPIEGSAACAGDVPPENYALKPSWPWD